MIPKVASLPSLSSARTGLAWRNAQVSSARQESGSTSHNRRRSLDARLPRSRPGSAADLASLDAASAQLQHADESATLSRPISPAPPPINSSALLFTVAESPACTPHGSFEERPFNKFAALLKGASSRLSTVSQNKDGDTGNGMGQVALDQQQQQPPMPSSPSAAMAAAAADHTTDDLAFLMAACGDLDEDVPLATAPASSAVVATPAPSCAALSCSIAAAAASLSGVMASSPLTIAAAIAVAATATATAAASEPTATAAKPASPPALQLPLPLPSGDMLPPPPALIVSTTKQATDSGSGNKASKEGRMLSSLPSSPPVLCFPPRADQVHVYHAHANFSYVQELLGNLQHVHHMFKGAAGSGSGASASSAVAAAHMLSRSLARAAQRVRNACLGSLALAPAVVGTPGVRLMGGVAAATDEAAARVVLAREALHTLTEFGWAELVTCDAEQAKVLGALDLEVHDLAMGRVDAYHRQAPHHPWVHVGVSGAGSTSATAVAELLGPASPLGPLSRASSAASSFSSLPAAAAMPPPSPCTPVSPAPTLASAGSSCSSLSLRLPAVAMGGVSMTVAHFAQQLQEAGASVMSAAQLLQQWVDELRAAADAKTAEGAADEAQATGGSVSCVTPQLVTVV